jgi:type IV secretion system protein VirB6
MFKIIDIYKLRYKNPFLNLKRLLSLVISIIFISFAFNIKNAYPATIQEQNDEAVSILENLTCEVSGLDNLLRSEFSHTCISAPFSDFVIANMLSPGVYVSVLLRLKINDQDLFPNSCSKENRLDPFDPKISFGFCNNFKLTAAITSALAVGTFNMISDLVQGKSQDEAIKNSFTINKSDFHDIYNNKKPGDTGVLWDIPVIPWKVVKYRDQICVATIGIAGWMNVGCRYMKEPYPDSIYDLNPGLRGIMNCSLTNISCYERAKANAANMTSISGPVVTCVRDMTLRLLVNPSYCGEDKQTTSALISNNGNIFQTFQRNMFKAVSALLTIYIIFVGFNIVLAGDIPEKGELLTYALKVILVIYFSVGINTTYEKNGFDGMTSWVFPVMLDGASQLVSWILNADSSNLCQFEQNDYNTAIKGYWNLYSIWDALDCRVLHYLGLNTLSDTTNSSKFLNFSIPPYMLLLIPAIYTGNFQLIMLAISYPLMVISVAAYLVNTFVISLVVIVILGVMSPIFVPMVLFKFTKGYFSSWFKLMLSFTLQPMVVATFLAIMFSVFDQSFYNSCKYNTLSIKQEDNSYKKVFFLDINKGDYAAEKDFKACVSSLGGILNFGHSVAINSILSGLSSVSTASNPDGSYNYKLDSNPFSSNQTNDEIDASSPFKQSRQEQKGIFFTGDILIFEFIRDLILSMFTGCVILYLMNNFSSQLAQFASDITEGVSLGDTTIGPKSVSNKGYTAVDKINQIVKASKNVQSGGDGGGR